MQATQFGAFDFLTAKEKEEEEEATQSELTLKKSTHSPIHRMYRINMCNEQQLLLPLLLIDCDYCSFARRWDDLQTAVSGLPWN